MRLYAVSVKKVEKNQKRIRAAGMVPNAEAPHR